MSANDDLTALMEAALNRAAEPLSVVAVRKALPVGKKPAKQEVQNHLDALVAAGRVYRWPGAGKKFSAVNPLAFAKDAVVQALSAGPLTQSEIKQQVPKSAKTFIKPALLATLVGERLIQKHPKLGKRQPFGVQPPAAADYLPAEIDKAFKQLFKLGFDKTELTAALRSYAYRIDDSPATAGSGSGDILEAMPRLNSQAGQGALIYVGDLRAALSRQFPDKESFDRAVLELAEQGKVQLQTHAWPGRLSESERNALVSNGRGGFFDAIGLRLE